MSNNDNQENLIIKGLKAIDQMGITPQLLYQRKNEYTTVTGGIISSLMLSLYVIACFFFGQEIYLRKQPTVLQSNIYQTQPETFNLTKNNFGFFVGVQGTDWNYYIDPTIYRAKMNIRSKISTVSEEGKFEDKYSTQSFDMVKCNLDKNFENFKNEFKDQDLNNLLCAPPDIELIQLEGSFDNKVFRWFDFEISNCKNDTQKDVICKSKEEIDKKLGGGFFVLNYIDPLFDPKNYESPEKYIRKDFFTSLSNSYFKEITFWQRNIDYISDAGIVFSEEVTKKFIANNRVRELYDFRKADVFIDAVFRLDNEKEVVVRKYIKVQSIIAEVGGFVKGINVICAILFYFFAKTDFYSVILEKIYFYKGNDDISLNHQNYSENIILKSNPNNLNDLRENNKIQIKNKRQREVPVQRSNSNNQNENKLPSSENNNLPIYEKGPSIKKLSINESSKKIFNIGILEKIIVMFKLCLPRKNKLDIKNTDIIRISIDQIMDRFDCKRYLENLEEMKIIKEVLFNEDQNIIINKLRSKKREMKLDEEISNNEFINAIKRINDIDGNKNMKLKKIINNCGLI